MRNQLVYASLLFATLLILGCTQPGGLGGEEAIGLAKAIPQINSFLSQHPGASATAVYLSEQAVEKQLS
mgnify:FL=1